MPDELLLNRYQLQETLGEGATSTVVKAFDTRMERSVAIKIIPVGKHTAERALREARTTALLHHPNIVTVYEFERDENNFYLIMEYVQGYSLETLLGGTRPLPEDVAVAIAIQVCQGLEAAHSNNIIHRDIKPANLIVMPAGRVRIMDFGISRLSWVPITREGEIVGTFTYMSPEQSAGMLVDERSDVFSLGVILYEMLTGVNPFAADEAKATLFKIQNVEPKPVDSLSPAVSPEIAAVVTKALAKNPDERYDLATDLRYKLERYRRSSQATEKVVAEFIATQSVAAAHADPEGPFSYLIRRWQGVSQLRGLARGTVSGVLLAAVWLWLSQGVDFSPTPIRYFWLALIIITGLAWEPLSALTLMSAIAWTTATYSLPFGIVTAALFAGSWWYWAKENALTVLALIGGPAVAALGAPLAPPLIAGMFSSGTKAALLALASAGAYWLLSVSPQAAAIFPILATVEKTAPTTTAGLVFYFALWVGVGWFTSSVISRYYSRFLAILVGVGALAVGYRYLLFPAPAAVTLLPSLLRWATLSFIISLTIAGFAKREVPQPKRNEEGSVEPGPRPRSARL